MTDLTKWLPLWEKCPELEPKAADCQMLMANVKVLDDGASKMLLSALIRDKAVWWLSHFHPYELATLLANHNDRKNPPTEGLRFTVCKILGLDP